MSEMIIDLTGEEEESTYRVDNLDEIDYELLHAIRKLRRAIAAAADCPELQNRLRATIRELTKVNALLRRAFPTDEDSSSDEDEDEDDEERKEGQKAGGVEL